MSDEDPKPGRDSRGRFTKGASPNAKGRPRNKPAPPASSIDVIFSRTVMSTAADGTRHELTADQALQQSTLKNAMSGKAGAIKRVLGWLLKRERWIRTEEAKKAARARKYQQQSGHSPLSYEDPENANDALQLLGIASRDEEYERTVNQSGYVHLQLEQWAVEKALARRRAPEPFTDSEIRNIEVCTHNSDSIDWPKGARV